MNKSYKKNLLICFLVKSASLMAGTYVGNGGNSTDVELRLSISEINATAKAYDVDDSYLCECPPHYQNNALCRSLNSLSATQREFCSKTLLRKRGQLIKLTNAGSEVKFQWSDEHIKVSEEEGTLRVVDAATQAEKMLIIVDKNRFLDLGSSARIALLAHEIFHLITFEEQTIGDHIQIGPFQKSGEFFDTLGASMAVLANDEGVVSDYSSIEKVSRAYKNFFISLNLYEINHKEKQSKELALQNNSSGTEIKFEYKFYSLGMSASLGGDDREKQSNVGFKVKEDHNYLALGLAYHFTPFSSYMTRWSQTLVSLSGEALLGTAEFTLSDDYTTLRDTAKSKGGILGAQIAIPLIHGFWITNAFKLRLVNYRYPVIRKRIYEYQTLFQLGVSYGF